jgi:ribosomal protein S18 acetylase RimI-like enzyme
VTSYLIRAAAKEDAASILELWRVAGSAPSRTNNEESIHILIERDPDALLAAEEKGRLVGTLVAAFDGWRGTLFRLAVHPDRRRRGIGRALVRAGERRLRDRGAVRISLLALKTEQVAHEFWLAAGYSPDDYTQRFVKNLD